MKIKQVSIFVIFLIISYPNHLNANPISALKHLFKQGDEAAKLGKHSDDVLSTRIDYYDQAVSGLSRSEVDEINSVISGMYRYSKNSSIDEMASMRTLLRGFNENASDYSRSIPLSEDFPFIKIRAHRDVKFDGALRSFSLSKYQATLSSKFDVEDLKVVPLGLSDDVSLSLSESARYKRTLGRHNYDQVGPLSRMHSANYKSLDDYKSALEPYRGKTVIFVGHIPDDIGGFFVFRNGAREKVDIERWMKAADDTGVNIIPIGCNSERLSRMGAEGIINSGDVLDRLVRVIQEQPETFGKFLKTFSSDDISLIINTLESRFFSNSVQIVSRERNRAIGRIAFEVVRTSFRITSWWDNDRSYQSNLSSTDYDFCFVESTTPNKFDSCVTKRIEQREKEKLIDEAKERESRRLSIITDIEMNSENWLRNSFIFFSVIPIHLVLMFICPMFFIVGFTSARWDEQEFGVSFRRIFLPSAIREAVVNLYYSARMPKEGWVVLLFALASVVYSLLFGVFFPLYQIDKISYDYESFLFVAMIMIGVYSAKFSLGLFWESFKEKSLALLVSAVAPLLLFGSSNLLVLVYEIRDDIRWESEWLIDEHNNLKNSKEADLKILGIE